MNRPDFDKWIEREFPRATGYERDLFLTVWNAALETTKEKYVNRCPHEWYQGHCVHCDVKAINGRPA